MTAPLAGVLVADFSRVLAGPLATMTMADLGATVVKVERPGTGDETRGWGPPWTDAGSSSYFESVNRGKRSVALDLADGEDNRLARELAARADVLVENFRVGGLDPLGLGYADVAAANPGVVYCSISGFGSGAGAAIPGYDFIVQAVGGLMSVTGDVDGDPTKVGVALVDVLTAKDAVIAVLAALRERESSGQGQHIELNLLSSLLGSLVNQLSGYLTTGRSPGRMGNQHPSIAPYETLRAADGPLAVACGNDGQFGRLATVLGRPELATDPRFVDNRSRVAHRAELVAELEAALATAPAGTWEERLRQVGVPAGVVADVAGAVALADRLGLEPTWEVAPGRPRQVSHPARYSRFAPVRGAPPPALGEHDTEVRAWLCGDRGAPLG